RLEPRRLRSDRDVVSLESRFSRLVPHVLIMAQLFKIEGLSDLLDGLEELNKPTQANVIKRALKDAGEPIAQAAEQMAPRLTGRLKASIDVSTRLSSRQKRGYHKESQYEIYAGAGALRQATLQEFGTRYDKPQPYMRPAWDQG